MLSKIKNRNDTFVKLNYVVKSLFNYTSESKIKVSFVRSQRKFSNFIT